jgi:hypothetical protein
MSSKIIPCIYGRSSSGKSTIIAALAMFCRQSLFYDEDIDNVKSFQLLDRWIKGLETIGEFPEGTALTTFQQVNFGFHTSDAERILLHFLEVAGEHLKGLEPGFRSDDKIPPELKTWLERFNRLLLVLPSDAAHEDITGASHFLRYAQRLKPGVPTCLVRSKWDLISDGQRAVLDRRFIMLSRQLTHLQQQYGDQFAIIDFSIGVIRRSETSTRLERFLPDNGTQQLLAWITRPEDFR